MSDLEEKSSGPNVTIVIPTHNSGFAIGWTLDMLKKQEYPHLEVIVVDAGSTDTTLDVVQRTFKGKLRLYSVTDVNLYEMYNRGISLAKGEYVTMLLPGDSYLSIEALKTIAELIESHNHPDLVYSASLLGDPVGEPRVLYRPFTIEELKNGKAPTTVESMFFKVEMVRRLGKFDSQYRARAGLDFLCRFIREKGVTVASTSRVLVEHDRRLLSQAYQVRRSWDTQAIIRRHFGLFVWAEWLFVQHPWQFLKMIWRALTGPVRA